MGTNGSITELLLRIRNGETGDVEVDLFEHFYSRLVRLASSRLQTRGDGGGDEEDIALSALNSYFRRAADGNFPETRDRDSIWSLLARITLCKTRDLQRKRLAEKRDARRMVHTIDELLRNEPPEWFVDSFIAEGSDLLDSIPEEGSLRAVTKMRMEGYSRQEIADALHISLASVKRKLSSIREHLEHVLSKEASQ